MTVIDQHRSLSSGEGFVGLRGDARLRFVPSCRQERRENLGRETSATEMRKSHVLSDAQIAAGYCGGIYCPIKSENAPEERPRMGATGMASREAYSRSHDPLSWNQPCRSWGSKDLMLPIIY